MATVAMGTAQQANLLGPVLNNRRSFGAVRTFYVTLVTQSQFLSHIFRTISTLCRRLQRTGGYLIWRGEAITPLSGAFQTWNTGKKKPKKKVGLFLWILTLVHGVWSMIKGKHCFATPQTRWKPAQNLYLSILKPFKKKWNSLQGITKQLELDRKWSAFLSEVVAYSAKIFDRVARRPGSRGGVCGEANESETQAKQ